MRAELVKTEKEVNMTYREFYTAVSKANVSEDIALFALEALGKLDKKNENKRKSTSPNQKANEDFKTDILTDMEANPNRIYTAKEIADQFGVSTQKVSALLKQMVDNGNIIKYDNIKDSKGNKVKGYQVATLDDKVE